MNAVFEASFARDLKHIKDKQLFRRVQQVIEEIKAATALSDIQNLKKMQQTQTKQVEQEMTRAAYVAAFIGHEPGKALFVGLYSVERWKKSKLSEWRGIYYLFDTSDGKGYVGSAYGEDNLLGRWLSYAAGGYKGVHLLRQRDPRNFRFAILQRVSPDEKPGDVIRLESSWKQRLHTRQPYGLNDN